MVNPIYQAVVRELETVLPPRVVSQSLQEGLREVGKAPDALSLEDAERLLKAQVFRRLQTALSAEGAKEKVREILGRLEAAQSTPPAPSLHAQARAIKELGGALKPFNLYFEWGETQKLRAQLQLLEAEHAAGRDARELIGAARAQLGALQQKLEDQLTRQERELAALESTAEAVRTLQSPKVRRLENLLNLVRGAQEARQLAPAEIGRARQLAADLLALLGEHEAGPLDTPLDTAQQLPDEQGRGFGGRLDAALRAFKPVAVLNTDETLALRATLKHLEGQREAVCHLAPILQAELDSALGEAEALIGTLQETTVVVRAVASQLMSGGVLESALGFPASDAFPALASSVRGWLEQHLLSEGVRGAVLLSEGEVVVAGEPRDATGEGDLERLREVLDAHKRSLDALGREEVTLLTPEAPSPTLIAVWPTPTHSLALLLDDPSRRSAVLHRLHTTLPDLVKQLR